MKEDKLELPVAKKARVGGTDKLRTAEESESVLKAILENDVIALKHQIEHGIDVNQNYLISPESQPKLFAAIKAKYETAGIIEATETEAVVVEKLSSKYKLLNIASILDLPEIVQILLDNKAVIDQWCDSKGSWFLNGTTALIIASILGNKQIVEILIKSGADVNKAGKDGLTALIGGSREGHKEVVSKLIEAGAAIDQEMKDGSTALMEAGVNEQKEVLEILIKSGADVNKARLDSSTALMEASYGGQTAIVKSLLSAKIEVDKKDKIGDCALSLAAQEGNVEELKLLLKAGANVYQQDKDGWSILEIARFRNQAEIVKLLLEHQDKLREEASEVSMEVGVRATTESAADEADETVTAMGAAEEWLEEELI